MTVAALLHSTVKGEFPKLALAFRTDMAPSTRGSDAGKGSPLAKEGRVSSAPMQAAHRVPTLRQV